MSRYSRINAIWRKELIDTLRDRRTVIAMVVVPMVLYPALILVSLLAFEFQAVTIRQDTYTVAVASEAHARWLRRLIDTDLSRQGLSGPVAAEDLADAVSGRRQAQEVEQTQRRMAEGLRADARSAPPRFQIVVASDLRAAVTGEAAHVALALDGPIPGPQSESSTRAAVIRNDKDFRSEFAAAALEGILQRSMTALVEQRLRGRGINPDLLSPLVLEPQSVATQAEIEGWFAGLLIPPILILLTITGTVYPAIDLTAGERERGTLETLMVAPVPPVDLIAGKFIVVTLIGLLSAVLNLAAFGATLYLGGIGELLTSGWKLHIPLRAVPWILLALLPLATMFGAILLAVSSFARSFKEAQNYVMPVIMAALLPALISALPGTELKGANLIIPVANIVLLIRELFMGHFQAEWIFWVTISTGLYAAAAVVVAAKLFGQEAVLFADSASLRTMLQRRHFRASAVPSAAQALLLLAIAYPISFFVQSALARSEGLAGSERYLYALGAWMVVLFVLAPLGAALYLKIRPGSAFAVRPPGAAGLAAALCLGASTWILALKWSQVQQTILPMDEQTRRAYAEALAFLEEIHPLVLILFLGVLPAVCEELFFRGFVLSGLRRGLGAAGAVLVVAIAFGLYHQSTFRMPVTVALGAVLGLLTVRWGSLWPAVIVHLMHNTLLTACQYAPGFRAALARVGWTAVDGALMPGGGWVVAAAIAAAAGLLACALRPPGGRTATRRVAALLHETTG